METTETITPELLKLMLRDEAICWLCNKTVTRQQASRDHVIPKSLGGPNHIGNYKLAHRDCNSSRGNDHYLPSRNEVVNILREVQRGLCGKCNHKKPLSRVVLRQASKKRNVLKLLCATCGANQGQAKFPTFSKRIKLKKIRVNEKRVPMDMSVIDRILALQTEEGDYARFHDITGALHSGEVLKVEDLDDVIEITLSDDEDGDAIAYQVKPEQTVELLGYVAMAV